MCHLACLWYPICLKGNQTGNNVTYKSVRWLKENNIERRYGLILKCIIKFLNKLL